MCHDEERKRNISFRTNCKKKSCQSKSTTYSHLSNNDDEDDVKPSSYSENASDSKRVTQGTNLKESVREDSEPLQLPIPSRDIAVKVKDSDNGYSVSSTCYTHAATDESTLECNIFYEYENPIHKEKDAVKQCLEESLENNTWHEYENPIHKEKDSVKHCLEESLENNTWHEYENPIHKEKDAVKQCLEESLENNTWHEYENPIHKEKDSVKHCLEDSLENNTWHEYENPIHKEMDSVKHCLEKSSDSFLSGGGKKENATVRLEPDKYRREKLKYLKQFFIGPFKNIIGSYGFNKRDVKEVFTDLHFQKALNLIVLNETLVTPSKYGSYFSIPSEAQVHYLEARAHPQIINGIPWKYLNNERYRLMSFVKFPSNSPVSTIKLASKGFAYLDTEPDLKVICFFCTAQFRIFNNEQSIDEEHRILCNNCPMVRGSRCNNISMENQRPNMTADDIFSQLQTSNSSNGQVVQPSASAAMPLNDLNRESKSDKVRSTQPSDESASFVIVTNTSDLAESDGPLQNAVQTMQSSQIMDDSVSSDDRPQEVVSSQISDSPADDNTLQSRSTAESTTVQPNDLPQEQSNETQNVTDENGGEISQYEKLGIITARPKRLEYAVYATRFNSYAEWPSDHHMKPDDLAQAGYFYTGYSDCARCFYCGGGLRNWEAQDNVWVEHARWFPKCAFLLQEVGKDFIETVQQMSKERDEIRYEDVTKRMQGSNAPTPLKFKERVIERDPAVLSVIDNGFDKDKIYELALEIRKLGDLLSSDKLYEAAKKRRIPKRDIGNNLGSDSVSIRKGGNEKRDKETIDTLRNENTELRQQTTCKICMDNEVAVVFLPCGHLVSCTECSCALTMCPLCRVGIKGIVRAYIG